MVRRIIDYLTELAKSRSEIKSLLESKEAIIKEHLLKLYFWRDLDTKNHWEGEIFGNVPELPKLKGSNKFLSKDKILEYLYSYFDVIEYHTKHGLEIIELQEPNLPERSSYITSKDCRNFKCFCDEFFDYVGNNLSRIGIVDKRKTYTLLDRLLQKYPLTFKSLKGINPYDIHNR